ncbi:diguanylate cyclase [Colwellia sp. 6_MG-2023]|uniref:diguanylate cyclase n=1 Tax=Colwellia sp. 6_MG-2023 TaxID=3062676 RepID=UPI0026E37283|nr:diguanylate cyclase [Colwellia sp. 6_MG-2023]MDO6489061.1 diguanylate cyclase [Colwellia sp. 6_MG-2023]
MNVLSAFILNVAIYSIFPLLLTTVKPKSRTILFYVYISTVLVLGGVLGSIYSFKLSENIVISGGTIAFGAFMMSITMLIIIERNVSVINNVMKLVLLVNTLTYLSFKLYSLLLDSDVVINHLNISIDIFQTSFSMLLIGGGLIILELLILLFLFIQIRKVIFNISFLAFIYTAAFIVILCIDGLLFPLIAIGLDENLSNIIMDNITGKLILALSYSFPMLIFYWVFKRHLVRFLKSPIQLKDLMTAPRKKLLEELHRYEMQDQQLRQKNLELLELSNQDSLTSLANRRKFDDALNIEWKRCERSKKPLTLVIGDLDFFKQYNDQYGHQKGDHCLRAIAVLWGKCFSRPADLAARIGGEEFAMILPETLAAQCVDELNLFMQRLQSEKIPHIKSMVSDYVTMSIGVASAIPNKDSSANELLDLADKNLYQAKQQGKNRIISTNN